MNNFAHIREYVEELRLGGLPGCCIMVRKNHEVLFEGEWDIAGDQRVFLYSCSKIITMTAVMMLRERGMLRLDDPVKKYLPEFAEAYIVENGEKKAPRQEMTLRHLMTMTGGLDYNLTAEPICEALKRGETGTAALVNAFVRAPLSFSPGEKYQYSLCHDVAAAVVEIVSGKPFREFLREEIFEPLGMKKTSMRYAPEEIAPLYRFDAETRKYNPVERHLVYQLSPDYDSGGAGVIGTMEDLSLFLDALSCGGKAKNGFRLLKEESIAEMSREQVSTVAKQQTFGCLAGDCYGYALGVRTRIIDGGKGTSPVGEFGWDGAAGSYELCDPVNGVSITFITHVLDWPGIREDFSPRIRDAVYQDLEEMNAL